MKSKFIFLGCGAVSKCCIYYLPQFFKTTYNQVTIIDKDKNSFNFPTIKNAIKNGANHHIFNITRDNITTLLDKIIKVNKHDIVIDLTTNTPTYILLKECRIRKLLYINTSIEDDEPLNINKNCPIDNSIFLQHINLLTIANKTSNNDDNITSIIEFGMNPGLISIFVKQGIINLTKLVLKHQIRNKSLNKQLLRYYKNKDHKNLAQLLDIKAIHCSEIDTQIPQKKPKQQFINTWSSVGLITEGIEPAEIQIGTHEQILPFDESNVSQIIPQLITTKTPGKDIHIKSIVPLSINKHGNVNFTYIEGRCIHHGEGISLNRYIGSFQYSPTMHYAYKLNPITDKLLDTLSQNQLIDISNNSKKWKVLNVYEDKLHGYDNVGALFVLDKNPITNVKEPFSFWTGSILHTDYTKNILNDKYFGPTIIQVMAGILSGIRWMIKNKNSGITFGEDLDDNYIINLSKKYLGKYYSGPVDPKFKLHSTTLNNLIVKGYDNTSTLVSDL
jgi:homospermidine synthase